jgi:hypothetical protein
MRAVAYEQRGNLTSRFIKVSHYSEVTDRSYAFFNRGNSTTALSRSIARKSDGAKP